MLVMTGLKDGLPVIGETKCSDVPVFKWRVV